MTDFAHEIETALLSDETITQEKVLTWIENADDLRTLSKLYRLTEEGYHRIHPQLGHEMTCSLIQRYLLECIQQDIRGDDQIKSGLEAARSLHAWFCHLAEMDDTSAVLKRAAQAITNVYLESDTEVQVAIEQGFLEHALEMETLRPYFQHWSSDARLQAAWSRALEWGEAHPGYTWNLLQQLRNDHR
jgi:hypothetical protein